MQFWILLFVGLIHWFSGDSRLRLFISHGGLLSTLESAYHGAPVLGMPVFLDQKPNMKMLQIEKAGKMIQWHELTARRLKDTIHFLMTDKT